MHAPGGKYRIKIIGGGPTRAADCGDGIIIAQGGPSEVVVSWLGLFLPGNKEKKEGMRVDKTRQRKVQEGMAVKKKVAPQAYEPATLLEGIFGIPGLVRSAPAMGVVGEVFACKRWFDEAFGDFKRSFRLSPATCRVLPNQ